MFIPLPKKATAFDVHKLTGSSHQKVMQAAKRHASACGLPEPTPITVTGSKPIHTLALDQRLALFVTLKLSDKQLLGAVNSYVHSRSK